MDRDSFYIGHILKAINQIAEYLKDVDLEKFRNDALIQDGVIRELEIIGEAAKNVSEKIKKAHPDIPWFNIAGMRNRLIHEYFGVDLIVVWKTVTEDLPVLKGYLDRI